MTAAGGTGHPRRLAVAPASSSSRTLRGLILAQARDLPQLAAFKGRFGRLCAASGFSNLADGIGLTAAPLPVATLTRDPLTVSGLTIAQRLPWFLFTRVSGALEDRLDRRRVM